MISEAIERMRFDLHEMQSSNLAQKLTPEQFLVNLVRTVQHLALKLDSGKPPIATLDAEEVWAKWRLIGFDIRKLQKREVRSLCASPETALRPKLIDALSSHPENLSQVSTVFGLVNAYWQKWRSMEEPHKIEALILNVIGNEAIRRRSKVIAQWAKHRTLFSNEAANHVAAILVQEHTDSKRVLAELFIDPMSLLARRAQSIATQESVRILTRNESVWSEEKCLQELRWIVMGLTPNESDADVFRRAMAELIICALPERFPSFKRALTDIVHTDDRLGDPRLPDKAVNWRTLPQEARDRFVSWIAGETLQFFFDTIVPRNDENRRRAEFWLQYVKRSRNVRDFQVAVSSEDEHKIRAVRAKAMPTYSRMKTWDLTSAFLMVFHGYGREYVVIEFSETGNAAYVYEKEVFESKGARMRSPIYDLSRDLKRMRDVKLRIIHIGSWESSARSRLAELGIRP